MLHSHVRALTPWATASVQGADVYYATRVKCRLVLHPPPTKWGRQNASSKREGMQTRLDSKGDLQKPEYAYLI